MVGNILGGSCFITAVIRVDGTHCAKSFTSIFTRIAVFDLLAIEKTEAVSMLPLPTR